jgi:hypothetical protein
VPVLDFIVTAPPPDSVTSLPRLTIALPDAPSMTNVPLSGHRSEIVGGGAAAHGKGRALINRDVAQRVGRA